MAERINCGTLELAFQRRIDIEFQLLYQKLQVQLREDISRIYSECLYSDFEICFKSGSIIKTHSSLLQSRSPLFFTKLLGRQYNSSVFESVDRHTIASFIGEIYIKNDLGNEEEKIVQYLEERNNISSESPDSDVYLTPKASPSDFYHCHHQSVTLQSDRESPTSTFHKTNALYYSLVTVEEEFKDTIPTKNDNVILERELAEQDELLKSFRSIICKERKSKKHIKPSSLTFVSNPQHRSKCVIQETSQNKKKCQEYKLDPFGCTQEKNTSHNLAFQNSTEKSVKSNFKQKDTQSSTYFWCPTDDFTNKYHAKGNQESVWKMNHRNMSMELTPERDDTLQSIRDQGGQALDSNIEGESSGYLTRSSPKNHSASEVCIDDITHTRIHECFQHKNDHIDASFQVSLDTGTWDSMLSDETYMVSTSAPSTNLPDLVRVKAPGKDLVNDNAMSLNKKGAHEKYLSEDKSDLMLHGNDSAYEKVSVLSQAFAIDKSSVKIDDGVLMTVINDHITAVQPSIAVEDGMNEGLPKRNGHLFVEMNTNFNLKNNFFIDASSLFDENELTQSSLTKNCKKLCSEAIYETNLDSKIKLECGSCSHETTVINNPKKINCISSIHKEAVDCTNHSETFIGDMNSNSKKEELKVNTKQDMGNVESPHRASLIRRKTFELDPDDEKLALLRQEYERRQGNSIFQTHSQAQSDSTNPPLSEFEIDGIKSIKPSDSLQFEPKKNVFDEEIHSPDSLNNDGPLESIGALQRLSNVTEFEGITVNSDVKSMPNTDNDILNTNERNVINCTEKEANEIKLLEDNKNIIDITAVNSNEVLVREDENDLKSFLLSGSGCFEAMMSPIAVPPVPYSPLMSRRKTEFAPILSGGVEPDPQPEPKPTPKPRNNSLSTSWVVDMSNGSKLTSEVKRKCLNDSTTSNQSTDYISLTSEDSSVVSKSFTKSCKSNGSSLGFFFNMDGLHNQNLKLTGTQNEVGKSSFNVSGVEGETKNRDCINSACGFYIDFSNKEDLKTENQSQSLETGVLLPEKKLFSMFIDISDSSKDSGVSLKSKKVRLKTQAERFASKYTEEANMPSESHSSDSSLEVMDSAEVSNNKYIFTGGPTPPPSRQISTAEHSTSDLTTNKKSFFMFIDADSSPVPKRRTLPTGLRPSFQRHSWNSESLDNESQTKSPSKSNHQRAHSVSTDESPLTNSSSVGTKSCNLITYTKNVSSENSSGFYDSGPSSIDDNVIHGASNNKVIQASWHRSVEPNIEFSEMISQTEYQGVKTSNIARFKCSKETEASSKTIESFENTNQISMEETSRYLVENLDTLSLSNGSSQSQHDRTFSINEVSKLANSISNDLDLSTQSQDFVGELSKDESSKTALLMSESSNSKSQSYNNETPTNQDSLPKLISTVPEDKSFVKLSDMDKEPEKLAFEEKRIMNRMSRSIPEATWLESKMMTRSATSRSLSRLFPHLAYTPEPDEADYSELSSMQSSLDPSALEGSTEETDESLLQQNGPCSRLGEDLLRMFLDEISADVTVQVGGRRIKAHKCILSSRCQYFAAMLSGGWVESAGNVISLQGFSYNAVHFALCHIYSGANNVPDSINIVELATLADMLCLEGLKEVIIFTLKVKYCHFFHKPCSMCVVGVLECLPLAAAYGLDEIYRKSLRWITKYFVRVWPTKGFATLPRELIDKCYKQHIINMNVENVLETIISCEKLESTTTNVRWAEPVFIVISKLRDAALKFIVQHFSSVLSSEMFLSLGKDMSWNISHLEETLLASTERLPPDQACKSYSRLYNILQLANLSDPLPEMTWTTSFVDLLHCIYGAVESSLVRQANRAVRCPSWSMMEPKLRQKIQDTACLVIFPVDDRRKARHSTLLKRGEYSGLISDTQTPKVAIASNVASGKRVINSVRPLSSNQNTTHNKKQSTTTAVTVTLSPRPKSAGYKVSEVKSRYLEQRPPRTANLPEKPTLRRNSGKPTISSSDSSRNSSPAMHRSLGSRTNRASTQQLSVSTDSLADIKGPNHGPNMGERTQRTKTELNVKSNLGKVKNVNLKATALKTDGIRSKSSPVATVSKKPISQNSSKVVDSPLLLKKTKSINSTPSPLLRRTILPSVQNNKIPSETKQMAVKKSTFRIQNRGSLSPTNIFPKGREVRSVSCNDNSKVGITKPNGVAKAGDKRLLLNAGSRSSTFLKDGPTFPKKNPVNNVQ